MFTQRVEKVYPALHEDQSSGWVTKYGWFMLAGMCVWVYLGTWNNSVSAFIALVMAPTLGRAPAYIHDLAWIVEKPNGTEEVAKLVLDACWLVWKSKWYRIWQVWMVGGFISRVGECYFARCKLVFYVQHFYALGMDAICIRLTLSCTPRLSQGPTMLPWCIQKSFHASRVIVGPEL